jgi:hypothetical protein
VASTVSGLKYVWKCLASHKKCTKTNRWKHQHPKRTYCRKLTLVRKSPHKLYSLSNLSNMKSLGWRVTWQNIKVGYWFKHFYWTFVLKLKFCSHDVTMSMSRILVSIDCRFVSHYPSEEIPTKDPGVSLVSLL